MSVLGLTPDPVIESQPSILGLSLRTKGIVPAMSPSNTSALSSPDVGSGGWWPFIRESFSGAWQRNETLSIDSVLANPTVYACISLIAADISKMRCRLMMQDEDDIWVETENPAFSPVLRKPNRYQIAIKFFEWWMVSKLTHGNTYALKQRDQRGVVVGLYILNPTRVKVLVAPDGSVFYRLDQDILSGLDGESLTVPAREIIHDVMCPLFHPLIGVSPIFAAGFAALLAKNISVNGSKFFANGSKPGGVLTAPGFIKDETAKRLKDYWEANFTGDNVGKVAVLGDGLKYEAMSVNAVDAQLIEQLQWSDEQIARCFHMPRHKVGIGPDPTFDNVEALNQQYYSDCLQSPTEALEGILDDGLGLLDKISGVRYGVEFNRDDLLQMDTATLIDSEKNAKGIKKINESRRRLNLPPVKGGDTVYLQQQDFSLEALNRRDTATPAPPTVAPDPTTPDPNAEAMPMKDFAAAVRRKSLERLRRVA